MKKEIRRMDEIIVGDIIYFNEKVFDDRRSFPRKAEKFVEENINKPLKVVSKADNRITVDGCDRKWFPYRFIKKFDLFNEMELFEI